MEEDVSFLLFGVYAIRKGIAGVVCYHEGVKVVCFGMVAHCIKLYQNANLHLSLYSITEFVSHRLTSSFRPCSRTAIILLRRIRDFA